MSAVSRIEVVGALMATREVPSSSDVRRLKGGTRM
jgi:hypothetical protein